MSELSWGLFWAAPDFIFEASWAHAGLIELSCLSHVVSPWSLGSFVFEQYWGHLGLLDLSFLSNLGDIVGSSSFYFWNHLWSSRARSSFYFGVILGSSWAP